MSSQGTLQQQLFTWQKSMDPDNDAVTYTVYLGTSVNNLLPYATDLVSAHCLFNDSGSPLNRIYYWQVVASDGKGEQTASVIANFRTYRSVDVNITTTLIGPANGAEQVDLNPTLAWSVSAGRKYDVYIDAGAGQVQVAKDLTTTSYTLTGLYGSASLEPGTVYSWQVVSKTDAGVVSLSAIHKFTTTTSGNNDDPQNAAPAIPVLLTPVNETTDIERAALLTWSNSSDPEDDAVTYSIYASTNPLAMIQQATGLVSTDYQLTVPQTGETWYWNVTATDAKGNSSTSETWTFTTAIAPQPEVYTISGIVTDEKHAPLYNAQLTGFNTSIYTDRFGTYEAEVPAGWSGEVVLQASGHTFAPETRRYTNVSQSYRDQNYEAQLIAGVDNDERPMLSVYPNPTSGSAQVKFRQPVSDSAWIIITDGRGSEVLRKYVEHGSTSTFWDGAGVITDGVYCIQFIDDGRSVASVKMLVKR